MKKIFLSVILSLFVLVSYSQDRLIGTYNFTADLQYLLYNGTSLDVVSSTKDSLAAVFTMSKTYPTRYNLKLKLDTVHSGAAKSGITYIVLQGRDFTTDTFVTIRRITSNHQASDTSMYFSLKTEDANSSTFTLAFDTTLVYGRGGNAISTFAWDTVGSAINGTLVNKNRALYSATGTITTTGTAVKKYYYQYRILIIRVAGSAKLSYFETRFIQ